MSDATILKILLVEDSESDARLLLESIQSSNVTGLEVNFARSLAEAMEYLENNEADAVLLDLSLPDSSGLETVERLVHARSNLPVVVLTGVDDENTGVEALRLGAQDYLVKGQTDGRIIARAVRYAVERRQADYERDRLLRELDRQRRLLQAVFDNVPIGLALLDEPDHRYALANPAQKAIAGGRGDIEGRKAGEVWTGVAGMEILRLLDQVYFSAHSAHVTEIQLYLDRGRGTEEAFFNLDFMPLRDNDGRVAGVLTVSADTTSQVHTRWQIEQSELRFRKAVESFPYGFAIYDAGRRYVYLNAWGRNAVKLNWRQVEGKRDEDLFPKEVTREYLPVLQRVIETGTAQSFEWRMPPEMGGRIVIVYYVPLLDDSHRVYQVLAVLHDITESRQKERDLQQLNRTLKALGFSSQAMMRATDEPSYLEEVCRIIVQDCGHAMVWIGYAEEDEGKTIRPAAHSGFEEGYLETLRLTWSDTERGRGPTGTAIRTGKISMCRNMLTDPAFKPWRDEAIKRGYASSIVFPLSDGSRVFGALTIYSKESDPFSEDEVKLLDEIAGDLAYGITSIRLRAAHDQAVEALRQSELRYRTLFDSMTEGFALHEIICDEKGTPVDYRFLEINQAFERYTGLKRDEVIGKTKNEVLPEDDDFWIETYGKVALTGEPVHFDNYSSALDRHYEVFSYRPAPGQFAVLFMDITESKRLEAELVKSQKLESVGILAGGIAHDFNNLLTAVLGNISLAKIKARGEGAVVPLLEKAEYATVRAAELTKRLITFAKGGMPLFKAAFAGKLIEEAARFSLAGSNADCRFNLPGDLWPVKIDEGQIRQVIQNIVINAREAMPEGGHVDISARNIILDGSEGIPLKAGKYIGVTVRDYGTGISADDLPHVFDPYFSTKSRGSEKGMGLGLAVCYSIIAKHEGIITAGPAEGTGALISFYLPASDEEPEEKQVRGPRVLIMDDEELILETSGVLLRDAGFEVEYARDGAGAVEMFTLARNAGRPFDAVILDLTVPGGMGGQAAAREILNIDPHARAIVSSGYLDDPVMADFRNFGFAEALPKPFSKDKLIALVSRITGR